MFEILCNFSCFEPLLKLSQICNALSTKTLLLSIRGFHEQLWSSSTGSMSPPTSHKHERVHLFLLKLNLLLSSCVCLCLRIYSGKRIQFSKFIELNCAFNIFELRSTLAKPAFVVLSSSQTEQRTLKKSKSASMVSPSF